MSRLSALGYNIYAYNFVVGSLVPLDISKMRMSDCKVAARRQAPSSLAIIFEIAASRQAPSSLAIIFKIAASHQAGRSH